MGKKYFIHFNYGGKTRHFAITSSGDYSEGTRADEAMLMATIDSLVKLFGLYQKGKIVGNAVLCDEEGKVLV